MKNKIYLCVLLFAACTFSTHMSAQLKITDNGNVGIKCSAPLSNLAIGSNGQSNARLYVYGSAAEGNNTGNQYGIYSSLVYGTNNYGRTAIYGYAHGFGGYSIGVKGESALLSTNYSYAVSTCGVYGIAGNGSTGKNYGVYGTLREGNSNGAGVCGMKDETTPALTSRYAGYFQGQTRVNGTMYATSTSLTSDARLKTNITEIKADAISKVKELHPVQFQWQQVEDVIIEDTVTIKVPHFSSDTDFKREHYGLIAQDVQKLFPQLVDEDGAGYLSVNYVELIPLLIQAVQELSAEVEELKAR
ncbi:MAG: tail fiber domain-containing protein [Paludibacteraceae bacterium]|nr:tail fiber domain-containing protein [Paludibacteraceae bacterium]